MPSQCVKYVLVRASTIRDITPVAMETRRITLYLAVGLWKRLKMAALERDVPVRQLVNAALRAYLATLRKKRPS